MTIFITLVGEVPGGVLRLMARLASGYIRCKLHKRCKQGTEDIIIIKL